MSDLNGLTVIALREKCKEYGLTATGSKAELIARLMEADPTNSWVADRDGRNGVDDGAGAAAGAPGDELQRREIELYRRELELAERELELARREIAMLRGQRRQDPVDGEEATVGGEGVAAVGGEAQSRTNLKMIGELLGDFDGVTSDFDTWEKQVRFVKQTYRLEDDHAKILIGAKLKKKALEWFHSRPEYVSMPFETLLEKLSAMFQRRESKLVTRKKFESRIWRKDETFHEYIHEKVIMGNRVPIDEDELIEHVIDGILDTSLRD